jgi:hypothetical protein
MRKPTPQEFEELVELLVLARDEIGLTAEQAQAAAEECWPKEVVDNAFTEARQRC